MYKYYVITSYKLQLCDDLTFCKIYVNTIPPIIIYYYPPLMLSYIFFFHMDNIGRCFCPKLNQERFILYLNGHVFDTYLL